MEERLIEKVGEYPILYNDQQLIDYRDTVLWQTVCQKIGNELEITTGNEAKEQWDKLRRCFNNARSRQQELEWLFKKKNIWKYEEQMAFLLPYIKNRKTISNLNELEHSTVTAGESDMDDIALHSEHESDEENEKMVQSRRNEERETRKRKRIKSKGIDEMINILKDNYVIRKQRYENKYNHPQSLDETNMFFFSMSAITKKLPKREQLRIKLEISKMVLFAEMEQFNNDAFPSMFQNISQCSLPSTSYNDCSLLIEVMSLSPSNEN